MSCACLLVLSGKRKLEQGIWKKWVILFKTKKGECNTWSFVSMVVCAKGTDIFFYSNNLVRQLKTFNKSTIVRVHALGIHYKKWDKILQRSSINTSFSSGGWKRTRPFQSNPISAPQIIAKPWTELKYTVCSQNKKK